MFQVENLTHEIKCNFSLKRRIGCDSEFLRRKFISQMIIKFDSKRHIACEIEFLRESLTNCISNINFKLKRKLIGYSIYISRKTTK